ncbi:MAG TPA: hypothetical protein VEI02_03955, partial [Planctomycetota bacterium]|nr:hypothetical protein [Planctomycetota bacterium]
MSARRAPIGLEHGRVVLRRRGRVEPAHFAGTPAPDAAWARRFAALGVPGVCFSATADAHPYGLASPVLDAAGRRDFGAFDATCRAILAGAPDAALLPRIHVASTEAWDAAHSDELVEWEDGRRERSFGEGYLKRTAPSFSSRRWREYAADNLRALLEHARRQDYADALVGVLVCGGHTEEWFHLGATRDLLCDGSAPAREAWDAWRAARGLEPAPIPDPARRRAAGPDRFRTDPDVVAYERFFSEEIADVVGLLCGVVQEVSEGRWAAGAFYGYLVEMACHGAAMRHGGHLALDRALADPRIDFLSSPTSYVKRDARRGASQSMLPTASVAAAGKAVLHENDVRTFRLRDDAGYGWSEHASESAAQLRREADFVEEQGLGLLWFDMTGTFYDDPVLEQEIAEASTRGRRLLGRPREPAPVVFAVDVPSLRILDLWGDWYADLLPRQLAELRRTGVAV